jgi:type III secretion system low calcium response chaperone LcrH/SycD
MSEDFENNLSEDELLRLVEAVIGGVSLAEATGISREAIESLYGLGYNLYNAGDYENAETIFQSLCLYDFNDPRFWQGLGGVRQALGKYQQAVDAYAFGMTASALGDPEPVFHAGVCFLKMGDMESATGAFEGLETLIDPANPAQAALWQKASDLLEIIRERKEAEA